MNSICLHLKSNLDECHARWHGNSFHVSSSSRNITLLFFLHEPIVYQQIRWLHDVLAIVVKTIIVEHRVTIQLDCILILNTGVIPTLSSLTSFDLPTGQSISPLFAIQIQWSIYYMQSTVHILCLCVRVYMCVCLCIYIWTMQAWMSFEVIETFALVPVLNEYENEIVYVNNCDPDQVSQYL